MRSAAIGVPNSGPEPAQPEEHLRAAPERDRRRAAVEQQPPQTRLLAERVAIDITRLSMAIVTVAGAGPNSSAEVMKNVSETENQALRAGDAQREAAGDQRQQRRARTTPARAASTAAPTADTPTMAAPSAVTSADVDVERRVAAGVRSLTVRPSAVAPDDLVAAGGVGLAPDDLLAARVVDLIAPDDLLARRVEDLIAPDDLLAAGLKI